MDSRSKCGTTPEEAAATAPAYSPITQAGGHNRREERGGAGGSGEAET